MARSGSGECPHFSQNLRSPTAKALLDNSFSVQIPSFHIQQCVNR
ncbi:MULTISPECIES: hypothetical protein [Oscillatoriales]|nr:MULTISPECIES: hypothetical protein [Oscillatoriales]